MRVTSQHWEVFIAICETHPNLVTNRFNGAQGKAEGNALWANVANKLNGLGLGEKSIVEWRRAVTDWKCKVKSKASKLRQSALQTGGGSSNILPLTHIEEKLIAIMGRKGFEGDNGIKELGIPTTKTSEPVEVTENVIEEFNFDDGIPTLINSDIDSFTMPVASSTIPITTSTSHANSNEFLKKVPKRKHDRLSTAIKFGEEHDYCDENNSPVRGKRTKIQNIPRISQNIENMTSESLTILKNIDQNTARIADSFEKLVNHLIQKPNN